MMVLLCDANIADAAMFASRGLEEAASATRLPWMKQDMIIRIVAHLLSVILRSDHGRYGCDRLVDKDIGNKAKN